MLKMLREQVNAALTDVPVRRRPALRRSDAPDALLATDLPLAADAEAVQRFMAVLTARGWRIRVAENGWLLLDTEVPVPAMCTVSAAGECACCLSILQRHPENGAAENMLRAVVKAAEAGRQPFERLCGQLHAELAAMLRRHEPLPGALIPYLSYACHELYK